MMNENLNATAGQTVASDSPSREEWEFPLLGGLKNWLIGMACAALVVMGGLYAFYLYQRPAPVDATKPAIADMGIPISPAAAKPATKTAIKKKAPQAINTPAIAINSPEITPSAAPPEPLTPAEQDFANRLAIFEGKTP